jgi:hypothetical protein
MMQVMRDIGGVEFPETFVNLAGAKPNKAETEPSVDGHAAQQKADA